MTVLRALTSMVSKGKHSRGNWVLASSALFVRRELPPLPSEDGEEAPAHDADEGVEGAGNALGGEGLHPGEDHHEDEQGGHGGEHRPDDAEGGLLVLGPEVALGQRVHDLAVAPQVPRPSRRAWPGGCTRSRPVARRGWWRGRSRRVSAAGRPGSPVRRRDRRGRRTFRKDTPPRGTRDPTPARSNFLHRDANAPRGRSNTRRAGGPRRAPGHRGCRPRRRAPPGWPHPGPCGLDSDRTTADDLAMVDLGGTVRDGRSAPRTTSVTGG